MIDDRQLVEALDCCRPGSDDLRLSELADAGRCVDADPAAARLSRRLQNVDRLMKVAVCDGAEPAGLAERILARLGEAQRSMGDVQSVAAAEDRSLDVNSETRQIINRTRRSWAWQLLAVAASLIIAVGAAVHFWPSHHPLSADALLTHAGDWVSQLRHAGNWKSLPSHQPLDEYPMANAVGAIPRQWADASAMVGAGAIAYDLTDAAGHRAALLVIPSSSPVAGTRPPMTPDSSTGGLMIGCWQAGGMVYVLVVEGDQRAYRNLIDVADGPLA